MNLVDKYNQLTANRAMIVVNGSIDTEKYPDGTVFYNIETDSLYFLFDA